MTPVDNNMKSFITKMKWQAANGNLQRLEKLQINTFLFTFPEGIEDEKLYEFFGFLDRFNRMSLAAVRTIYVWLYQQKIPFSLKFHYNRHIPFLANLFLLRAPKVLVEKAMLAYGHDMLMNCSIDKLIAIQNKEERREEP